MRAFISSPCPYRMGPMIWLFKSANTGRCKSPDLDNVLLLNIKYSTDLNTIYIYQIHYIKQTALCSKERQAKHTVSQLRRTFCMQGTSDVGHFVCSGPVM